MLNRHWLEVEPAIRRDRHEDPVWLHQSRELDDLEARSDLTDIERARREFLRTQRTKGAIP
jgi:hypothetical protein